MKVTRYRPDEVQSIYDVDPLELSLEHRLHVIENMKKAIVQSNMLTDCQRSELGVLVERWESTCKN